MRRPSDSCIFRIGTGIARQEHGHFGSLAKAGADLLSQKVWTNRVERSLLGFNPHRPLRSYRFRRTFQVMFLRYQIWFTTMVARTLDSSRPHTFLPPSRSRRSGAHEEADRKSLRRENDPARVSFQRDRHLLTLRSSLPLFAQDHHLRSLIHT